MPAQGESTIQLPLVGGIVETVISEQTQGAILSSLNTRLSQDKGSLAPRPGWVTYGAATSPAPHCYGVVPGCGDSALAIFASRHGSRRIIPSVPTEQVLRAPNSEVPAPGYIAAKVTGAGGVNATRAGGPPSVAIDNDGNMWVAWRAEGDPGEVRVHVEVRSPTGELLAPRTVVAKYDIGGGTVADELAGWTALIATNIGVSVVYSTATPELFHAGFELNAGVVQATYAPQDISGVLDTQPRALWRWDACPDATGTGMFFVCSTGDTTAAVRWIDLTPAFSASAFATLASPFDLSPPNSRLASAVTAFTRGGVRYVGVATSGTADTDVRVYLFTFTGGAFTPVWAETKPLSFVDIGVLSLGLQPHHETAPGLMLAATGAVNTADAYNVNPCLSTVMWIDLATGTDGNDARYYFANCIFGRGASYRLSDDETYALFATSAKLKPFDDMPWLPSEGFPVPDPAAHLCIAQRVPAFVETPASAALVPIGRLGLDGAYPAAHLSTTWMHAVGARVVMGYALVDYQGPVKAAVPRWVELDLAADEQPSHAPDAGGVSTIAAAHPATWDGHELVDASPLHAPLFVMGQVYATLPSLPAGSYAARAIFRYRDGAGQLRRSAPSLPLQFDSDGTQNVTMSFVSPLAMRDAPHSSPADCVVYVTEADGSIFYYAGTAQRDVTNSYYKITYLEEPNGSDRLFSTGADNEPLLPVAPPAFRDVVTCGPRQYAIDAEYPNRVWATKLKERGIAFEWAAELTMDFGQQAGELVRVVSVGGRPQVLAQRGVWAITGDGPDNTGAIGSFGDPQLISTRGCRNRESVAIVPGIGAIFEAEDGVLTMTGPDGLKRFETIAPRRLGCPSIYLTQHEVVWPIKESDQHLVYNYLEDAFTIWNGLSLITTARCDVTPADGITKTIAMATGARLATMLSANNDYTAHVSVERAWVAPAGPNVDCVARELWIRLLRPVSGSPNSLTVRVEFDYGQGPAYVQRTWTATELANPALLQGDRITLCMNLHGTPCRSMRLLVGDGGESLGSPMRPLGAELTFGVNPANLRRVLPAAAIK